MDAERICAGKGYPNTIWVDNGSEFTSRDLDLRAYAYDVTLDFSRSGKWTDNGFNEAINRKLRADGGIYVDLPPAKSLSLI